MYCGIINIIHVVIMCAGLSRRRGKIRVYITEYIFNKGNEEERRIKEEFEMSISFF